MAINKLGDEWVAFVKVYNLINHDESVLDEIELAINKILEGDAVYTFPKDPSVVSEEIPVVVEVISISPKATMEINFNIKPIMDSIKVALENIFFHKRPIIVIIYWDGGLHISGRFFYKQ